MGFADSIVTILLIRILSLGVQSTLSLIQRLKIYILIGDTYWPGHVLKHFKSQLGTKMTQSLH